LVLAAFLSGQTDSEKSDGPAEFSRFVFFFRKDAFDFPVQILPFHLTPENLTMYVFISTIF